MSTQGPDTPNTSPIEGEEALSQSLTREYAFALGARDFFSLVISGEFGLLIEGDSSDFPTREIELQKAVNLIRNSTLQNYEGEWNPNEMADNTRVQEKFLAMFRSRELTIRNDLLARGIDFSGIGADWRELLNSQCLSELGDIVSYLLIQMRREVLAQNNNTTSMLVAMVDEVINKEIPFDQNNLDWVDESQLFSKSLFSDLEEAHNFYINQVPAVASDRGRNLIHTNLYIDGSSADEIHIAKAIQLHTYIRNLTDGQSLPNSIRRLVRRFAPDNNTEQSAEERNQMIDTILARLGIPSNAIYYQNTSATPEEIIDKAEFIGKYWHAMNTTHLRD